MAWDFRPGMKVVCVDASPSSYAAPVLVVPLVRGQIYTIDNVHVFGDAIGVGLVEIHAEWETADGVEIGLFKAERFRPVRKTSIDCLRVHLATKPVLDRVEA